MHAVFNTTSPRPIRCRSSGCPRIAEPPARGGSALPLLLLYTRRPGVCAGWLDQPIVAKLRLEPLPAVRYPTPGPSAARCGGSTRDSCAAGDGKGRWQRTLCRGDRELPHRARRAARNRRKSGIRRQAVAAALPASVQNLLTARVDRPAPKDRSLLQAASVIGRPFDPELLAVAVAETDVDVRLEAVRAIILTMICWEERNRR